MTVSLIFASRYNVHRLMCHVSFNGLFPDEFVSTIEMARWQIRVALLLLLPCLMAALAGIDSRDNNSDELDDIIGLVAGLRDPGAARDAAMPPAGDGMPPGAAAEEGLVPAHERARQRGGRRWVKGSRLTKYLMKTAQGSTFVFR